MASLPTTFPIEYWYRLLPQIDCSVNIVRKYRQNPLLSAWASMEGEFHFNATPHCSTRFRNANAQKSKQKKDLWFQRKKVMVHSTMFQTLPKFKGIMASTGAERIPDTVRFKHHAITIPHLTPAKRILEAAR